MSIKKLSKDLSSAVLAGIFISLGASASLAAPSKSVGAAIFTLGLTAVLAFKASLFTGKCGYLVSRDTNKDYLLYLAVVWLGNLLGCICTAAVLRSTAVGNGFLLTYQDKLVDLVGAKGSNTIITSILCGALMYIAVEGFKRQSKDNIVLGTVCYISAVAAFVMCGFEHCVADMFYFALAGYANWNALLFLIGVTLGNVIGSNFIHSLLTWTEQN